jgi:imidazolonepropionase-like amidohydrolase
MLDDEAIELMLAQGTYLVADLYDGDYILKEGPSLGYTDEVLRKTAMTNDSQRAGFQKAVAAGVKVAFGTDAAVYPHGDNAVQFAYYKRNGLTGAQTIQSATRWAAEMMGWEDRVGSLSPGNFADLIAVEGDPLNNIELLESPVGVMKGGKWTVEPQPGSVI